MCDILIRDIYGEEYNVPAITLLLHLSFLGLANRKVMLQLRVLARIPAPRNKCKHNRHNWYQLRKFVVMVGVRVREVPMAQW